MNINNVLMKRLFLFLLLCCPGLIWAQMKPVTIIVTDTTDALIAGAHVRFGTSKKNTSVTQYDGRVDYIPTRSSIKVKIEAEDYVSTSFKIRRTDAGKTLCIRLTPLHKKKTRNTGRHIRKGKGEKTEDGEVYYTLGLSRSLVYHKDGAKPELMYEKAALDGTGEVEEDISASSNGISAGMLTAGEVNDFAKWNLWNSVFAGSHKRFVDDWKIRTNERYTAQIVNRQGYPLVNRAVSLVDAKGNTLFMARTDNTGRAELWNGLVKPYEQGALFILCEKQKVPARRFADGINTLVLEDACDNDATADVFFVVDATGSMADEMHYLQAEMKDVIRRSQSAVPGLQIRTGALVYRDHTDEYLTRIARLTDDIEATQTFLDKQYASGGGDYEEAIPEALMATINAAGWNDDARARIAFLVLDAPCHQDSATLALLHEQIEHAAAYGIRLVPVVCSGLQESGELLMRSLALATNGTSFFLTDDSGIGGTHLKPTTDTLKVEHLNDMLVRTIIEYTRMPDCDLLSWQEQALADDPIESFLPNPTDEPNRPDAPVVRPEEVMQVMPNPCHDQLEVVLKTDVQGLYLIDMSGKTILARSTAAVGSYTFSVSGLAAGVYFVKAYANGRWVTVKVIKA